MLAISNAISISLLGYFLILHIRLERAAKYSQQKFPRRWETMKHRCLFAVRFSIITLLFQTVYSSAPLCCPDIVDVLRVARNVMFFILVLGFSFWVQDSIKWMITERSTDRQPEVYKDLLG